MRGYFGIGVYHPKTETNVGTLWRSAYVFGASFIFVIGRRYRKQASDTVKAPRHIPLYEYQTWSEFKNNIPRDCKLICVEIDYRANNLKDFHHPERCIYVLGAEDNGIPKEYLKGNQIVQICGAIQCLNVAVAGSIIIYDRSIKQ